MLEEGFIFSLTSALEWTYSFGDWFMEWWAGWMAEQL
jgi:hypothetical protein